MGDARLEQARALAAAGQFRDAMGILKGIVQGDPGDAEARQLLSEVQDQMMLELQIGDMLSKAEALVAQGQREQARKTLTDILKVSPNHPKARTMATALESASAAPRDGISPEATLAMDAFDLEPLPGAAAPMTLESLDSIDAPTAAPFAVPAVESTVISGGAGNLGPAEAARVKQYVKEGQDLFAQGRYQDAIDVWTRIFIVDESNQEADNLIAKAKEALNANQGEIEHNLTEGIAAFNAGDLARSQPLLEKVIHSFPGHREALYYLSRISELAAAAPPPSPSLPPLEQTPQRPAAFSAPPPIYSAGQAERPAAPSPSAPTLSAGSPDEFELEDNLDLPTGEALRSPAPGASFGGFEFDSSADMSGFAVPGAPPPPPVSAPAAGAPAMPAEPEGFSWGQAPASSPEATPGFGAPAFGGAVEEPAAPARTAKAPPKAKGGGMPWLLIGAAVGILVLVGAGILAVFLLKGEGPGPATVPPTKIPKPQPPKVAPPTATPTTLGEGPVPGSMSPDELLRAAKGAEAEKDYAKAVTLYQELLGRGGSLNPDAASGLAAARSALSRQQAENERNEKFIKDYQYALKGYREGDYSECLRVAWRLIYPDDTLARQLGKRDAVSRLIRDGYYNWAVMDLKGENVRGADKNIRDLLDFDKNDPDARKLSQFIKPYLNGGIDQNFRDVARSLTYRPLPESP